MTTTTPHPQSLFDQLTDEQLVSVTRHHAEKFDDAWAVCMSTHYRSGRHIDAQDTMERQYRILGQLVDYTYGHRPHTVWDAVVKAANRSA
jgi:hypothetical protein